MTDTKYSSAVAALEIATLLIQKSKEVKTIFVTRREYEILKEALETAIKKIKQLDNKNELLKREVNLTEEKLNSAYKRLKDLIFGVTE
jgi:uncharacterized spore protein YtfJ